MKQCTHCNVTKPLDQFRARKSRAKTPSAAPIYESWCRLCRKEKADDWRQANRNRGMINTPPTRLCPKCNTTKLAQGFSRSLSSKMGLCTYCKCCAATDAAKPANKARRCRNAQVWHLTPEGRRYKIHNNHLNEARRSAVDPVFKFKLQIRRFIRESCRRNGFSKPTKTEQILGCTYEEFRTHLAAQFQPGWTLENHGTVWHIDHIVPLASAKTIEDVVRLCHHTNLRPLLGSDNLKKGSKLI